MQNLINQVRSEEKNKITCFTWVLVSHRKMNLILNIEKKYWRWRNDWWQGKWKLIWPRKVSDVRCQWSKVELEWWLVMTKHSVGGWRLISGGDGVPASILMLKSVEDLGEWGSKNDVYLAPEGLREVLI